MGVPAVIPLRDDQVDEAARVLARAFHNDPLQTYVLPEPDDRARVSPAHFAALLRYGRQYGEVLTTAGAIAGAAVWLPPDGWEITPERLAGSDLGQLDQLMGAEPAARFLDAIGFIEPFHHRDMPEPHWYAMVIGVDPSEQRRGVGQALLAPILARADADGLPCYLETAQPANVPFYQRAGFDILVQATEPRSALPMWTFRRDPPRR